MNRLLVGSCSIVVVAFAACNTPPATPTQCTIQGAVYGLNVPNPSNACQVCIPSKGSSSWSDLPPGTACGTGGTTFCSGGACLPGCLIASAFYPAGSSDPGNGCRACDPARAAGDWTPLNGVVPDACPSGQVCQAGACTAGCTIGGTFFAASAFNPQNSCQSCQPTQNQTAWSDLAPGAGCADGGGICNAGSCQSGCQVGGVFFANGTTSPTDVCHTCQPSVSTTAFSPFTGVAPGGCNGGAYCDNGTCSGGCIIGGTSEAPGAPNPANPCQSCQPSVNLTGWSDVAAGTGCGPGGAVCAGGVCLVGCQIGGILYGSGSPSPTDPCQTCQPAVSASSFSPFNGLPAGGCNGGETCNQGTCQVACFIRGTVIASRSYKPGDTGLCCSPGVDPSNWTESFARSASYLAGGGNSFNFGATDVIAAGDFNSDGFQDVAVVNSTDSTVSIFLNHGDGTFDAQAVYPSGTNPQAVAAGDLNGDHRDDVLVAIANGTRLGVLLSLGFDAGFDAGLAPVTGLLFSGNPFNSPTLEIRDVNGDLAPDLVAGNGSQADSVSVYLNKNNGKGEFDLEQRYNAGINFGTQVSLGDFDGNGSPDIAMVQGNFGGASVALLFNDGIGGFSAGASFPTGDFGMSVAAGDFNADGFCDVGVVDFFETDYLMSIGDGGLSPFVSLPINGGQSGKAADMNGDGLADLVVPSSSNNVGNINFLISQGTGTFAPVSSFPAVTTGSFVIRDFNGDGAPDLAIMDNNGSATQSWTLWLNSCP